MKKKIIVIFLIAILAITGCKNINNKDVNINKINILIIKDGEELYNKSVDAKSEMLLDILKEIDVKLEYKDDQYGAYIYSLMNYEQKEETNGLYYWAYYIDEKYADVGISNCKIEDGKTYKFVYEFYSY